MYGCKHGCVRARSVSKLQVLVALSAEPGTVSADGGFETNSRFTAALIRLIRSAGSTVDMRTLIHTVSDSGAAATSGRQKPWCVPVGASGEIVHSTTMCFLRTVSYRPLHGFSASAVLHMSCT